MLSAIKLDGIRNKIKKLRLSPRSLHVDVVLWHESFMSVHLCFVPLILRAQNLSRKSKRTRRHTRGLKHFEATLKNNLINTH